MQKEWTLVIGGGNGIGAACCRVMAERDWRVAVVDLALGRRVEAEEVAESVEFLASRRASAITGIDLLVDAGWLAASAWGLYGGVPAQVGADATDET